MFPAHVGAPPLPAVSVATVVSMAVAAMLEVVVDLELVAMLVAADEGTAEVVLWEGLVAETGKEACLGNWLGVLVWDWVWVWVCSVLTNSTE